MRLVLDFETYFDVDYSLKKMHTLEYVRDERFLVHGVAVKINDEPTRYILGTEFADFINELPRAVELICHNTYFDGLVLFHHYQFVPEVYRDTLSMARGVLPHANKHDLDYLCETLKLGNKIPEVLELTKGKRELTPEEHQQLATYAINDADLTDALYKRLVAAFPYDELALIDLTIRWGCCPVLQVDIPRAEAALEEATQTRNAKIAASGTTLDVLSSQDKFLELLQSLNIEVPYKTNKKGKEIPALAKNDLGFQNMIADNPEHRALFEGRMAAKSTIDVTRIKRVIEIGKRGTLPMPLKYYGAHTGRWSGADGLNPQNFRRGSELRKSIIAPPGYVILVADLKQIELRLNIWFCKEPFWMDILEQGLDVYEAAAAMHYNIALDEITDAQRFFGKTLELGLGYQMGHKKFRTTCALKGISLSEQEAYEAVRHYRATHNLIRLMWDQLSNRLSHMYQEHYEEALRPVIFVHEGIILPNGMRLDYSNLTPLENGNWTYGYGSKKKYIYGGKMLENIIQALGRIVLGEQLLAIEDAGIHTVSSTHDEPIMVVREADAEAASDRVRAIMTTPPEWAPSLPMAVDIGYAREYSK